MPGESSATTAGGWWSRRSAQTVLIAVAIVGATAIVVHAAQVLLLLFAGLLFGVFLDALTRLVMRRSRLGRRAALGLVVTLLTLVLAGVGWIVVPRVVEQATRLTEHLPAAWAKVSERVLNGEVPLPELGSTVRDVGPDLVRPVLRSVSATLTFLAALFVVAVTGIYAAAQPRLYVEGFVRLLPPDWRDLGREACHESARQLRRLLVGVGVAISTAGVFTGVGLWLLGIPYALGLGLLAALLEIIPNVGPTAAAIPAILLSLAEEEVPWWHVVILYGVVQTVQSYVIQPLVQQQMIEVPPVVLIGSVVLLGWLVGPLGVLMGVPLLVVANVLIRILYLRETLGEQPGRAEPLGG